MEKNFYYHKKRSTVHAVLSLIAILLAFTPIFFGIGDVARGFLFENKDVIVAVQIIFALLGFVNYAMSIHYQNSYNSIMNRESANLKKDYYNNIIQLVKDKKNDEALEALNDYNNNYN